MSSGPSRRNEKPRPAWSSCIEETPTSITTPSTAATPLRGADLGEIGKAVLDQGQPPPGLLDQIEPAGNGRAVAVDADDPGSAALRESRGCNRRRRRWHRHRRRRRGARACSSASRPARGYDVTRLRFMPPASASWPGEMRKLDANGPMAPQISRACRGVCLEHAAAPRTIADPRAGPIANPDFPMEFAGLPWDFEREMRPCRPPKPVRLFTT